MSENKKIKNATKNTYDGILFKSELETAVYKSLKEEGFFPEYESKRITVWNGRKFDIPCYNAYKDRKTHDSVWGEDKYKALSITYTPDFTLQAGDKFIVIEVKGYENDRYYIKKKLFRDWLDKNYTKDTCSFFEIRNKRQMKEMVNIIKTYRNEKEFQ